MGRGKETSEDIRPWKGREGGISREGASRVYVFNRLGGPTLRMSATLQQQPLRLAKVHLSARRPLGAMPALRARDDLFHARLDRRRQAALERRDAGEAGRASVGDSLHPFGRGADHPRRQGLAPWSRDSSGELARLGKRRRADWAARRAAEALRAAGLKREARPAHPDAEQLDDIELRIVRVTQPGEAAFPNAVVLAGAHGDRAAAQVPSKPMPVR